MERAAYDEMRELEDHHWWFRGKRRMLTPLIARAIGGGGSGVLVDVGCGTGANLLHVGRRFPGVALVGLDVDAGALACLGDRRLEARLLRGEGTRLPLRSGSLDCLLALDVIEHVEDDRALLAELGRVLRPGGSLVASVPACPSLWSPHDEFLHHKRRYRAGELEGKLREAGFAVQESHGFNFLLLPPIALVRRLRRRRTRRTAGRAGSDFFRLPRPLNALFCGLFVLEDAITRLVRIPFGVSILIRARRP